MKIEPFIQILKPQQWYKNILIFAALIFSLNLFNFSILSFFLEGFILLCLVSSASYIINDLKDLEEDRKNPEKRRRPLPSSKITPKQALVLAVVLLATTFYFGLRLNINFTLILIVLFLTNQIYTFWLKKVIILDVMLIAVDYVWRALAGAALTEELLKDIQHPPLSAWFIYGFFFIALLLALGKRRSELVFLGENAANHRTVFKSYTEQTLDHFISITSSMVILFYTLYTMNAPKGGLRLTLTIPVVVYAVYRYNYLLRSESLYARHPEKLFLDLSFLASLVAWILLTVVLLYT